MVLTWIGSDISGAHYNPITTVSNLLILAYYGIPKDNPLEYCCALLGVSIFRWTYRKCDHLFVGTR